ncbi:MAG: hypothetical protein RMJ33_05095 [Saprospiraceae bacterium]|nr:hypothetical protein [Saprospiraceae bacterium]MDW8229197.1 hypothetical protein [Saprospiraceae bacterium]
MRSIHALFVTHKAVWLSLVWSILCLLIALPLRAQQTFVFAIDGKSYRVEASWNVKHAGSSYANATAHTLDFSKGNAFDLEVQFRFPDEAPPPEVELLLGFQYRHGGSTLAPTEGEKRARGLRHFQRFQSVGGGNATLTLTPKVWRRTPEGTVEVLASGAPTTLGFTPSSATPAPTTAATPATPASDTTTKPAAAPTAPQTPTSTPAQQAENEAYAKASSEPDSAQRIRAFIDFLDQYRTTNPQSPNVQSALRAVPLSASLPQPQGAKKVSYVLDYAVRPVIDTAQANRWQWELKNIAPGRFQLTLSALSDTATTFVLSDAGKSVPFNRPRLLQPFEKVQVVLAAQTKDAFTLRLVGGTPPFMVYLLQERVTRMRYLVSQTDTTLTLSKAACTVCKDGPHTLEVYTGDFSTLLLREIDAIQIDKPNRWPLILALSTALFLLIAFHKLLGKWWRHFQYHRKLREIEAWERVIEEEAKRKKKR